MDGGLDHYSRNELLGLLAQWNAALIANEAKILVPVERATDMPIEDLRHVVAGTAHRLGAVVQAIGEQ
jgi:hypothetical protein